MDFTASAEDNFFLRAGDATSITRDDGEMRSVCRTEEATLKYFPFRTGALIEQFDDVTTHCFSGQTVPEPFAAMKERFGDRLA